MQVQNYIYKIENVLYGKRSISLLQPKVKLVNTYTVVNYFSNFILHWQDQTFKSILEAVWRVKSMWRLAILWLNSWKPDKRTYDLSSSQGTMLLLNAKKPVLNKPKVNSIQSISNGLVTSYSITSETRAGSDFWSNEYDETQNHKNINIGFFNLSLPGS